MLEYDRIDISEVTDMNNKTNKSNNVIFVTIGISSIMSAQ